MKKGPNRARLWGAGLVAITVVAAAGVYLLMPATNTPNKALAAAGPQAVPVSVAIVEPKSVKLWDEFSGRLEAVERVDIRSRVAGAIESVNFREGALVNKGDVLITIDPAPYKAEVMRAQAQLAATQARSALTQTDLERGKQLIDSRTLSQRDLDQRENAAREADANVRAAQANLEASQLNLDYTQIRAPVAGRVGRLNVTVGNLVAAGSSGPVLTTLVSVNPMYASFDADEASLLRALGSLPTQAARNEIDRIPVQMILGDSETPRQGKLQLIDNQIATTTGTVRVRAVFDNSDGALIPGQFARLFLGRADNKPVLLVNERAIGTDQDKRYVLTVDKDKKAAYRAVSLGSPVDGLRVITDGLTAGDQVIVSGLMRVRPGAPVEPKLVPMLASNDQTNRQ
ncbi:efflux RND transporter periplasmic adaptor subunit [Undibacter mobilis]|uniref:Efflux RND transporter periplasmic adaptor subunit n=1 Tax=Undibacter mobilis TaxID=2292256 RepID=A0A371B3G1_9BRAD|nr:efflux RND transporter periplasmic adaptor subunit [Undibacter mobilis]RDV02090.1 efflux RND transporter periplasmic adaptor subunit [Undibacter mobilis]